MTDITAPAYVLFWHQNLEEFVTSNSPPAGREDGHSCREKEIGKQQGSAALKFDFFNAVLSNQWGFQQQE